MQLYPEYDCSKCDEDKRIERGHDEDAPIPYWTDLRGEKQSRCPRLPIFNDPSRFNAVIGAYNAYKNGFLPDEGGVRNQAGLFLDIMSVVDNAIEECREVKRSKDKSKNVLPGTSLLGKS